MRTEKVFRAVHHTNVRVKDLAESIRFYTEILGFEYVGQLDLHPASPTISAYVRLGDAVVELAYGHDLNLYHTDGMIHHFALEVSDIQEAFAYVKEKNVAILSEPHSVNKDFDCFFIAGPSGERFEIIQKMELGGMIDVL